MNTCEHCGGKLALDQDADTGETFLVCVPCRRTYPRPPRDWYDEHPPSAGPDWANAR